MSLPARSAFSSPFFFLRGWQFVFLPFSVVSSLLPLASYLDDVLCILSRSNRKKRGGDTGSAIYVQDSTIPFTGGSVL